jgi:hypothetical protein
MRIVRGAAPTGPLLAADAQSGRSSPVQGSREGLQQMYVRPLRNRLGKLFDAPAATVMTRKTFSGEYDTFDLFRPARTVR